MVIYLILYILLVETAGGLETSLAALERQSTKYSCNKLMQESAFILQFMRESDASLLMTLLKAELFVSQAF